MAPLNRNSIRLPRHDYSRTGTYLITVVTWERRRLFGQVVDRIMVPSSLGAIAASEWARSGTIRTRLEIGPYIVMPDHIHGIIRITDHHLSYGPARPVAEFRSPSQTIGSVIRGFKAAVTVQINRERGTPGARVWQRNYHERRLRNAGAVAAATRYIENNPRNWTG